MSIPLYVYAESISAYQSADQWKNFTNIQLINTTPTDLEKSQTASSVKKFIRQGKVYIVREGKTYDVKGMEIR